MARNIRGGIRKRVGLPGPRVSGVEKQSPGPSEIRCDFKFHTVRLLGLSIADDRGQRRYVANVTSRRAQISYRGCTVDRIIVPDKIRGSVDRRVDLVRM